MNPPDVFDLQRLRLRLPVFSDAEALFGCVSDREAVRYRILLVMFIDPLQFPFVAELKSNWREIREEYLAIPVDVFEPWVQREMYGHGWSVFGLHAFGHRIEAALEACPRTAAVLEGVPGLTTAGFSRLEPGAHILPHEGWVSTVYRAHLGLDVPPDCALRVGSDTRSWEAGECLIFDDTVEHEAWNRSDRVRTILLFDFLRPGVTDASRDVLPGDVREFIRKHIHRE